MEQGYQYKLPVSQNETVNPLCVIFVKNGSKGDRLLFRYPYKQSDSNSPTTTVSDKSNREQTATRQNENVPAESGASVSAAQTDSLPRGTLTRQEVSRPSFIFRKRNISKSPEEPQRRRQNPYAIRKDVEDEMSAVRPDQNKSLRKANICMDLSDKELSNLLAVNTELSERKFEVKVNDVRFVGHPTLMQHPSIFRPMNPAFQTSTKIFHIVFCLHAMASHSIVKCFYDLSKRLGIALRHEEYRCGYLSQEMKTIIAHLDEEEHELEEGVEKNYFKHSFQDILPKSSLTRLLKAVYDDVCETGLVKLRVNKWIQLSFCLPQKIHVIPFREPMLLVEPENIHKCLESIRPYHALLLLIDREELAVSFWIDSSPTIPRLLQVYSPLKSLQTIAADADLTLSHVVEISSHLVYWGAATIIYPMCETNVYVCGSDAPITSTEMEDTFINSFPGLSLIQTLADFSLPMPLGERVNPVLGGSYLQAQMVQVVSWLLQYRLLIQLHTYIYLLPYLDDNGIENSLSNGQEILSMDIRPYELDPEDDVTMSDSYSETAGDELGNENGIFGLGVASTSAAAAAIVEIKSDVTLEASTTEDSNGDTVDGAIKSHIPSNGGTNGDEEQPTPETVKETLTRLSETARRAVTAVKPQLSIADIKLFGRLSRYFNGEYHFEEIMYRENVRRSQLLLLIDKFREVLIISEREDSSINFFKVESW